MLSFPLLRFVSYPLLRCPVVASAHDFSHDTPSRLASTAIERMKRPSRGGQNLSEHYRKLEKSLRGKEAISREIDNMTERPTILVRGAESRLSQDNVKTFRGFRIPEKPKPPEPDECCMSGCAICIHDLHQESLTAYKESVDSLRSSLSTLKVPESEWPSSIQMSAKKVEGKSSVVLSAFEEMERRLGEKREQKVPAALGPTRNVTNIRRFDASGSTREQRQTKKDIFWDFRAIYEGIRWILFSSR